MTIQDGSTQNGSRAATTRRGLLKCSLWAGTGILWTVAGGVPVPSLLGRAMAAEGPSGGGFTFAQISDSHIGFKGEANPDPSSTLQEALARLKALPKQPSLLLHTGDVTQLSTPEQFDTARQIIAGAGYETHYVPGEHDVLVDGGKPFFERFGENPKTEGWYSFDHGGVHFVGLINVFNFNGGLGALGDEQLAWLEADLKGHGASTPIVIMAHMPLWSIYPEWGWGTADADRAMAAVKRFGSVTVLNGHIHQVIQKVEGHVAFHTAMSTAFPQPAPGEGKGPGPLKVPTERLRAVLGVREVEVMRGKGFTVADTTLA